MVSACAIIVNAFETSQILHVHRPEHAQTAWCFPEIASSDTVIRKEKCTSSLTKTSYVQSEHS